MDKSRVPGRCTVAGPWGNGPYSGGKGRGIPLVWEREHGEGREERQATPRERARARARTRAKTSSTGIATTAFWKRQRATTNVLAPIIRSVRFCDSSVPGKAGLLWPIVLRLCKMVQERLDKVVAKHVGVTPPGAAGTNKRLKTRASEMKRDGVFAACLVHPYARCKIMFCKAGGSTSIRNTADSGAKPVFCLE